MRLRISHSTSYRYDPPATGVIQILRMTPGSHDGQYVAEWQIDVSTDSRLDVHQDAFGNVTHVLTEGPIADLTITVEGLIETHDTGGVLRGTDERFPPSLFLRSTSLTEVNPANGICTTDAHARVAIGLDYLGAAPVRGTRYGGGTETLSVAVKVDQVGRQSQWQSQS